jgi:hypothetical protein
MVSSVTVVGTFAVFLGQDTHTVASARKHLSQHCQAFGKDFLLRDEDVRDVDLLARSNLERDTHRQWLDELLIVLRRIEKEHARRLRDPQLPGKGGP